jgi:hypothetical protein
MEKPEKKDINIHNSLDEIAASDHFGGLDLVEAEELFVKDSITYQWDLLWMGPIAFNYYIKAAINYLKRDESSGDVDFIDALYQILDTRLKREIQELSRPDLIDLVDYIINTYQKFEVNEEIYGNLKEKFTAVKKVLTG